MYNEHILNKLQARTCSDGLVVAQGYGFENAWSTILHDNANSQGHINRLYHIRNISFNKNFKWNTQRRNFGFGRYNIFT